MKILKSAVIAAAASVLFVGGAPAGTTPKSQISAQTSAPNGVEITAPVQAVTGAAIEIVWSQSINARDYITVVPAGADEGVYNRYFRVQDKGKGQLVAPAAPGLYEIRYVIDKESRTLASWPIEIVDAQVEVAAPQDIRTGASFAVSWSPPIHPSDFVTIVPAGAEEGAYARYIRASDKTDGKLIAPTEPGLYEVRYVLEEGKRTLSSAPIEVIDAVVSITGPDIVRAETPLRSTWSETINARDYITIVPAGAKDGAYEHYVRAGDKIEAKLKAPVEPGLYEIWYVLEEGKRTLAHHQLEVVAANAALDDGITLSVPARASAGDIVAISWTGATDSADQRVVLARTNQPDFSWVAAHPIGSEPTVSLKMPDVTGSYEVRFLDVSGRKVLGRAIMEVE